MELASSGFRSSRHPEVFMRAAAGGVLLGLGLLAVWAVEFPEAQAQRPGPLSFASQGSQDRAGGVQGGSADLIALSYDAGEGRQQVAVIDPRGRALAVYHIDRATGELSLKSVRNLTWDLQIEDFNSTNPTPREIRALTEQR
jgi:hypothetical protein